MSEGEVNIDYFNVVTTDSSGLSKYGADGSETKRTSSRRAPKSRPLIRTAPAISRLHPHRILDQRAHFITFRSQSDSLLDFMNSKHYDESCHESYFDQCFEMEGKIGEGSFGEVYRVRSKEDGRLYAVKRAIERFRSQSDRCIKLNEVQKHEQLPKHDNLVNFVRAWEERDRLYIQTELCQSSLSDIASSNHSIPENLIWNYLVDLLLAVKHLHDYDLVHMDIKLENIFLSHDEICKLGDFGLVFDLKRTNVTDLQEGDAKYLAPEVLDGQFGKEADIFSLGISILELATDLELPQNDDGWHLLRTGCFPEELMTHISPDLKDIIKKMMHPNPRLRPSASQLLDMSCIKQFYFKRQCYLRWRTTCNATYNFISTAWVYFVAIVLFILSPILNFKNSWLSGQKRKTSSVPSSFVVEGRTPSSVDRLAMPLVNRFDSSFSDDDDIVPANTERSLDISSIRSYSPDENSLQPCQQPYLTHEDTSSSSSPEKEEGEKKFSKKIVCSPHPWNSTPAYKPKPRRLCKTTDGHYTKIKRRRLQNTSFSPCSNAPTNEVKIRRLAGLTPSVSAKCPLTAAGDALQRLPRQNLRLSFDMHGSSSGDEY